MLDGQLEASGQIQDILGGQDDILSGQDDLEQSILEQLQAAATSGNVQAQQMLDAIAGNASLIDEILTSVGEGNEQITGQLGDLGIDVGGLQDGINDLLSGQGDILSGQGDLEQSILEQLQAAADAGSAEAQQMLDAISGNASLLDEIITSVGEGNEEITGQLGDLGIDVGGLQDGINDLIGGQGDILSGQGALEQNILEQLQAAADAGSAQAQQMLDAIAGNANLLDEIITSVGEGNEQITGQLGDLGIDVSGLQDGINDLLSGQGDILGGQGAISGQLSDTEQSILDALNDGLYEAAQQGNANAQNILDAISSGDASVVQEILGGVSSGESNIINMLVEAGVDLDGLQQGINDLLAGQEGLGTQIGTGFLGLGTQLGEGLEGLAGQGQGLGMGLLGGLMSLGEGQRKAAVQRAAPQWKDFYSGDISGPRRDFQGPYLGGQPQQSNTVNNLNQMIARSLEMSPSTQGMFGNFQNKG